MNTAFSAHNKDVVFCKALYVLEIENLVYAKSKEIFSFKDKFHRRLNGLAYYNPTA